MGWPSDGTSLAGIANQLLESLKIKDPEIPPPLPAKRNTKAENWVNCPTPNCHPQKSNIFFFLINCLTLETVENPLGLGQAETPEVGLEGLCKLSFFL